MLSQHDIATLLEWNAGVGPVEDVCVHELIQNVVIATPGLTALQAWDGQLTYRELDDLSSNLARWLQRGGFGRGTTIPLLFEKSLFATIALLGVMKAGAAFVQLDVTIPEARLRDIISDLNAPLLLSSASKNDLASCLGCPYTAVVSKNAETLQDTSEVGHLSSRASSSDILYIMFTSGSTGKPKGVRISHINFASSSRTAIPYLEIDSKTRMFDFCSYAFDASIFFVLLTLMAGGCVCVPSESDRIERPEATLTAMGATTMLATPAVAQMLNPLNLLTLEKLMIAGEALSPAIVKKWTKYVPVLNLYGPCECTALCTGMRYEKGSQPDKVSIGWGVGCATWVVEAESGMLSPIGSIGELFIQGPNVGAGYLATSAESSQAFLDDASLLINGYNTLKGGVNRGYLTGDLVRYNANGSLDFLGRKDNQRKIRGQRVELAEVENQAGAFFGDGTEIAAEVCTAADAPETNMLVLFVNLADREPPTTPDSRSNNMSLILHADDEIRNIGSKLRISMSKVLPSYMVPVMLVKISKMPLALPSMKLDRKALRASISCMSRAQLSEYEAGHTSIPRAPETPAQHVLHAIWAEVLDMKVESIGLGDNFFRLGGDSVSAIKLVSSAQSQGVSLKMAQVLKNPVLSDMAQAAKIVTLLDNPEDVVAPFSLLDGIEVEAAITEAALCCDINKAQVEDMYPCTPLQEGLMAISFKQKGSQIDCTVFELPEYVEFPRLRAAWISTARVNSILRTRIAQLKTAGMVQVVVKEDPTFETAIELKDCLSRDANDRFGLGSQLVSLTCVGEDMGPRYIVRKMHHAVCDIWQDQMILEQVECAYREGQLPEETNFNNFVRYVLDQKNEKASAFWREQLAGAPPASFPMKPSAAYAPWVSESRKHVVQLQSIPSATEFALSVSIRLAWAMVLGAHMQTDDVVFGATLTGRNAPVNGIGKMTGPTIATVPLRIRLRREDTVSEALKRIQDQATTMIPFEQTGLQYIRKLSAEISEICDFHTLVVIQSPTLSQGSAIQKLCGDQPNTGFPFGSFGLVLESEMSSDGKKVTVNAEVDANLLDPEQVVNILEQFDHTLRQLCQYPQRKLNEIELSSPRDVAQITKWNSTLPRSVDRTLHDLFKEQCDRRPEAPAVTSSVGDLTFEELDDMSSRLAIYLWTLGVKRETVVPLFVGHSYLSAVAILGVLKSGGSCVCLDFSQPRQRVAHILHEVGAKIALIAESQRNVSPDFDVKFVSLNQSWLEDLPRVNEVEWHQDPSSAAFLIFTSGSTGGPKGIVMEHSALASGILSVIDFHDLGPACRLLQFASSVFDIFIHEHLVTLVAGGCICVPTEHEKLNELADFASRTRPNFALMTSTGLRSIDKIQSLQRITIGGEAIDPEVVKTWGSTAILVNGYGPAECCICASHVIETSSKHPLATIGRPFGSLFWLVDPDDPSRLCPVGVVGELLIEGPVLAREYFKNPEETSVAFIEAPQWLSELRPTSHSRLFRTGDLARYNADGTFVYVNRKDTQVKLRGCRIELSEVEYYLSKQLKGVPVTAEVVHIKALNDVRLVAFVSVDLETSEEYCGLILPTHSHLIPAQAVLQELTKSLPAYMIPSVLLPVRYLPKTASDKIDRKLLRNEAAVLTLKDLMAYQGDDPIETQILKNSEERLMSVLWADILKVPIQSIGSNANFFHHGGDSVVAMRLVSAARSRQRLLTVQDIFRMPVLSELSQKWTPTTKGQEVKDEIKPFSLLKVLEKSDFVIEHISKPFQIDIDDIVDVLPATLHQSFEIQNVSPCMEFDFDGSVDLDRLLQSWNRVVEKNEILRTVFLPFDGSHLQIILRRSTFSIEIHHVKESKDLMRENYKASPPAPGTSPLHIVVAKSSDRIRLSVRISHAMYDGWSIGEILKDWESAFADSAITERSQFRNFVYATMENSQDESYDYWRKVLVGSVITCLREPDINGMSGSRLRRIQTVRVIELEFMPSACTMATFVKACWALALARRLSTMDVTMMQLTSGRRRGLAAGENAIGPCLALLPVRVAIQPDWRPLDLCRFIQNQDIEGMSFENIELPDLISNCTDWPSDTPLGTIVHHQSDEWARSLTIQDKQYPVMGAEEAYTPTDVEVETELAEHKLKIEINSSSFILGEMASNMVADDFCAAVTYLLRKEDLSCSDFIYT